jgi:hypothetical protein
VSTPIPEYTALFLPGNMWTSVAVGDITAGDPLEVAGSGAVQRVVTPETELYVGIAATRARDLERVTVISGWIIHEGVAEGPIVAGSAVAASAQLGHQVVSYAGAGGGGVVPPHTHTAGAATHGHGITDPAGTDPHSHVVAATTGSHTHVMSAPVLRSDEPERNASTFAVEHIPIGIALTSAAADGVVRWMQK